MKIAMEIVNCEWWVVSGFCIGCRVSRANPARSNEDIANDNASEMSNLSEWSNNPRQWWVFIVICLFIICQFSIKQLSHKLFPLCSQQFHYNNSIEHSQYCYSILFYSIRHYSWVSAIMKLFLQNVTYSNCLTQFHSTDNIFIFQKFSWFYQLSRHLQSMHQNILSFYFQVFLFFS